MPHGLIDHAFRFFVSSAYNSWVTAIGSLLIIAVIIGISVGGALGACAVLFQKRRRSTSSPLVGRNDTPSRRPKRNVKYYDR